jgi:hypothetical protein
MYGRILVKDGSDQMVEALDQSSTSEDLRDDLGRRLTSHYRDRRCARVRAPGLNAGPVLAANCGEKYKFPQVPSIAVPKVIRRC